MGFSIGLKTFWVKKYTLTSFLEIKMMKTMLSNQNVIKVKINNRNRDGKYPSIQRLRNILLDSTWIKEEITREILKYFNLNEKKIQITEMCGAQ